MSKKPIIGISSSVIVDDSGNFAGYKRAYVNKDYVDAVVRAGGVPLIIPFTTDKEVIISQVQVIDALILSGGHDVSPYNYGQEPNPKLGETFPERDTYDMLLLEESKKIEEELIVLADELSSLRKDTALKLEKLIQDELKFLYMEKSTIKVDFKEKEFSSTGKDDVKILISANLGEPLKSLSKVASGGELSRVMLALKIIFSRSIEATSIIFDEIDTGVSGRVSQRMAEKMYQLGVGSQVLCISHLPQTTALADTNLLISKEIIDKRTLTVIRELTEEQKIAEVARMVSGDTMTKLSEEHSIEMLRLAEKTKADIKEKLNK